MGNAGDLRKKMRFAVAAIVYLGVPEFDEIRLNPPKAPITHTYYFKGEPVLALPSTIQIQNFDSELIQDIIEADTVEKAMTIFKDIWHYWTPIIRVLGIPEEPIPKKIFLINEWIDTKVEAHPYAFRKKEDAEAFIKSEREQEIFSIEEAELK